MGCTRFRVVGRAGLLAQPTRVNHPHPDRRHARGRDSRISLISNARHRSGSKDSALGSLQEYSVTLIPFWDIVGLYQGC
jgi:hypothetical protein